MRGWVELIAAVAAARAPGPPRGPRRPDRGRASRPLEPRDAVLLILAAVLIVGTGRKWLQSRRARRAVSLLGDPGVTPEAVREAAGHGRAALMDLFRILGTAQDPPLRDAAGEALATLWARDELIAEEEKAIVTRGFAATWRARRRYPRAMRTPIPVAVSYGVPFLRDDGAGVAPSNLEWSHRIAGAERASLEQSSPWRPGPGRADFAIDPGDFPTDGPHRLVLEPRARTTGLTDSWELALPHVPFRFEFDPLLAVESLLTLPDDARAEAITRAVRLERLGPSDEGPVFLALNDDLALRDPPFLSVTAPLPADLAHHLSVEFEGVPGRFPAGSIVLTGQGPARRFPIGPVSAIPIDRPGDHRMRAILTADPDLGWADPDVRSLWPGTIETGWIEARVIRR